MEREEESWHWREKRWNEQDLEKEEWRQINGEVKFFSKCGELITGKLRYMTSLGGV